MYRTGINTGVKRIDEKVNTAQEKNGHLYIGDIVQEDALRLNLNRGNGTLNPRQFIDLKGLLEKGIYQEEKVLYPDGKEIDKGILERVYDEIFGLREPVRC